MTNSKRTITTFACAALLLAACNDDNTTTDDTQGDPSGAGGSGAQGGQVDWGGGGYGGDIGGTGGTGGAGGVGVGGVGGGTGGEGGLGCTYQGFNVVDLAASYDPPGLPFEHGSANTSPRAAAASVPGSPLHYWRFDPNFGGGDTAAVTLELTCHNMQSTDLELSVVEARFLSGDWKFTDEGETVSCGETASFSITKPGGTEPNYLYRVRFAASAANQYVEYTIGAAATYEGVPGVCAADTLLIEPAGDDAPSTGEALSATAGTISAPFGNTVDFIADPDLYVPGPTTESVNVSLTCSSPHLELRLVTAGENSQLAFASQNGTNDKTLACGESAIFGLNQVHSQTNWFAMVTTNDAYDFDVHGAVNDNYSLTIE